MAHEKKLINSSPDTFLQYLKKVWQYRSLVYTFARRDIKAKYSQTVLGIGWTIVQPATALFLYTFFFGYILKWKTGDVPFALYVCSGLLGWNFFTYMVIQGSNSILESSHIIKKVYFPKLVLPLSKVLVALVELGISLLLLVVLMIWYGETPSWRIVFLPIVIFANIITAFTIVTYAGVLSYRLRDFHHAIPFLLYFGIWITPVFFSFDILPENLRFIWALNPMTAIVEGWRWCLFEGWIFRIDLLPSVLILIPLGIIGLWTYTRNESAFSDFI